MDANDLELIHRLREKDEELARLWREHQELEAQLDSLGRRSYLSPQDQMELKRLKKIKLAGRDRMEVILANHRREAAGA